MERPELTTRLFRLRQLMFERDIHVYIIPSEDHHHSEYTAPCDARREFLTGFTGSAGCAVVTADMAVLATDGRYFSQALKQINQSWTLLKQGMAGVPTWQDWAAHHSSGGKTVAVDPSVIPANAVASLSHKIRMSGGARLLALHDNLVDIVWGASRPRRAIQPVTIHPKRFAGCDVQEKLESVRAILAGRNSPALVISTLDDIAWLYNLRGSDIPYNPVFYSYSIVTQTTAAIYIDTTRLTPDCLQHLRSNNVEIRPYDAVFADSCSLCDLLPDKGPSMPPSPQRFTISHKTSWALKLALGGDDKVEDIRGLIGDLKAVKNEIETNGVKECHIRDGAAIVQFFAWLEDQLVNKAAVLDEAEAAGKLEYFRSNQENFVGPSFATVSATGANAAIIHYQPRPGGCSIIDPSAIYLCDSGAQYLDGTTDITRTLHFGIPTAAEKRAYTLVLKGHIALASAVFPRGTSGFALDCLARQYLRRDGLDYRHGTGHGVGSYLNVHEGPIGIGTRLEFADVPLQPGNIVSNEPGYYEDGSFGVRIENIVVVREVDTPNQFGDTKYLGFDNVTMVPLCRNLIDRDLLSPDDKIWLNDYHQRVKSYLQPIFKDDAVTLAWLVRETAPY